MTTAGLRPLLTALFALGVVSACDGGTPVVAPDSGEARPDASTGPVACTSDVDCPATYCNTGSRFCCVPADPPYEICGDRIDQDCDGRDTSCGDSDRDGVPACRPGEDPLGGVCDCDDDRADVRPPFNGLPGAFEFCDGVDNDCNGRVDEHAECCSGCASLGAARNRADICTLADECDCSTQAGTGPCGEGLTCCGDGCVNTRTDVANCNFCGAQCTVSADRCENGQCRCGDGPPCDLDFPCVGGACQM